MITAYYSSVLDQPVDTVWSLVRDFNNYPVYIDGVTESVIEDGKRGDEVGAVRRFNYWIRQRLTRHSDGEHLLTYAGIDPVAYPAGLMADPPPPIQYEGTIHLHRIVDGERTFIEWPVTLHADRPAADPWRTLFLSWIPE